MELVIRNIKENFVENQFKAHKGYGHSTSFVFISFPPSVNTRNSKIKFRSETFMVQRLS